MLCDSKQVSIEAEAVIEHPHWVGCSFKQQLAMGTYSQWHTMTAESAYSQVS
jgi:hypothetical protein